MVCVCVCVWAIFVYLFYLLELLLNLVQIRKITSIDYITPRIPTLNVIFIPPALINIYLTFMFVHRFFRVIIACCY